MIYSVVRHWFQPVTYRCAAWLPNDGSDTLQIQMQRNSHSQMSNSWHQLLLLKGAEELLTG